MLLELRAILFTVHLLQVGELRNPGLRGLEYSVR